jgi:hypothetical protein
MDFVKRCSWNSPKLEGQVDVKEGFATDKWYRALTFIAALAMVGVAAIGNDQQLRKALLLTCVGALCVGLGEWINHPYREAVTRGWKISGYVRSPKLAGTLLVLLGLALIGRGIYLLW